jgi:hypothetical protein
MFSAIRRRIRFSPATVIAGLALVFAMTGGAYAAKKYLITSTKQISPSVLKQLQGKAGSGGAPGAAGAQGAQGPAGSAGSGGAKGETGPAGTKGEKGATGASGAKGATGATGTTGFTETLPSGKTETGAWNVMLSSTTFESPPAETSISFPIPLASGGGEEEAWIFTAAQTTSKEFGSSGCTGSVEDPTAPKGTLCVYTAKEALKDAINSPGVLTPEGSFGFGKSGGVINGATLSPTEGHTARVEAQGTWAVTAP